MPGLDDLLKAASKASKQDRISWRDQIAECGPEAIPAMRQWLTDPDLGAFAVRVLEKIAERPADRREVTDALDSVDPETVSVAVATDIAAAMDGLGHVPGRANGAKRRDAPAQWSGYEAAPPLERRFHEDMIDIFRLAGEATRKHRADGSVIRGYWASYFLRGVRNHGGLPYARQLLQAQGTTEGFARLTEEDRLDLTMEALVLRPEYTSLFSASERQIAVSRLADAGYRELP